jgi:DNA gyrase/topoisomerase IV subunit A
MNNPNKNTTKCGDVFMDDYEIIDETIEMPKTTEKVKEEEIVEVQLTEKEQTQILIDDLLELSEFEENPKEKKKTMLLIKDLKELIEFM